MAAVGNIGAISLIALSQMPARGMKMTPEKDLDLFVNQVGETLIFEVLTAHRCFAVCGFTNKAYPLLSDYNVFG